LSTIGIFDSGIGGLSILNEALHQAPGHHYIYLADSYYAPYGEKSAEWIADRSLKLSTWLIHAGCEVIVVACNTATARAISKIRETFPNVPIIGVEPGIKPAAMVSKKKLVGVLATQNTLESDKFRSLLRSMGEDCEFISQAGIGLVPLIEDGILSGPQVEILLKQYIEPMLNQGADTLVLGCTHYPFLISSIKTLFGNQLDIIDTSEAVVRQMNRLAPAPNPMKGNLIFYSTKDGTKLLDLARALFTHDVLDGAKAHTVDI
jgi:glutamate racemase